MNENEQNSQRLIELAKGGIQIVERHAHSRKLSLYEAEMVKCLTAVITTVYLVREDEPESEAEQIKDTITKFKEVVQTAFQFGRYQQRLADVNEYESVPSDEAFVPIKSSSGKLLATACPAYGLVRIRRAKVDYDIPLLEILKAKPGEKVTAVAVKKG